MKNILFILCTFCFYVSFTSCSSDRCALEGSWKVSTAEVESSKLSESIIGLIKNEYMATTFEFNDGKVVMKTPSAQPLELTYTLDWEQNTLTWVDKTQEGSKPSVHNIGNCSDDSFELEQELRSPDGQEVTTTISFTIERVGG